MARYQLHSKRIKSSLNELADRHQEVAIALEQVGYPAERRRSHSFESLARIVIGQQVSVAAAASIARKVEAALGGEITASGIDAASDEVLRSGGLSRQKVSYMRSLAHAVTEGHLQVDLLPKLSDDEVVAQITAVKGFGVWSAHMYLMFALGRPDVWPVGDLAVRAGFGRMMGMAERPTEKQTLLAGEPFAPHRSALAMLCWKYYSEAPM